MREIFADYFLGNNPYHFKDSDFDQYFLPFNLVIRKQVFLEEKNGKMKKRDIFIRIKI